MKFFTFIYKVKKISSIGLKKSLSIIWGINCIHFLNTIQLNISWWKMCDTLMQNTAFSLFLGCKIYMAHTPLPCSDHQHAKFSQKMQHRLHCRHSTQSPVQVILIGLGCPSQFEPFAFSSMETLNKYIKKERTSNQWGEAFTLTSDLDPNIQA